MLSELQIKYNAAKEGVPQYQWVPPSWEDLVKAGALPNKNEEIRLELTSAAALDASSKRAAIDKGVTKAAGWASEPNENEWPDAFADFRHIDDSEFTKEAYEAIKMALSDSKPEHKKARAQLDRIVGENSPGMKRLAQIFRWSIFRATELLHEINRVLEGQSLTLSPDPMKPSPGERSYTEAACAYMEFLKDLDDREPETKSQPPVNVNDVKARSGYGRAMQWAYIDPVIHGGKILGAKVVAKWNPHSSSSTVVVNH